MVQGHIDGFRWVEKVSVDIMSSHDVGGLLAAVFGAWVGYNFPVFIVGVVTVGLLWLGLKCIFAWVGKNRQGILGVWSTIDSTVASFYYRNRVRFLVFVGRIDSK